MRNPIVGVRARLALGLGAAVMCCAGSAHASTVLEEGENGSEQMGRGGAWVARASDPLATFYNPAGLAGQQTKLTLQANINISDQCFTRFKALNDPTTNDGVAPGHYFPKACSNGTPFPDPQIAFTYRATERLGLGIAVLAPSAAGKTSWPENDTAPNRYLLASSNEFVLTPTIAAGWEPIDRLRLGLGLIWGVGTLDFTTYAVKSSQASGGAAQAGLAGNDIKGEVKGHDLFIPGTTAGAIWSPTDQIDIAGWYKVIGDIKAKGDIETTSGTGRATAKTNTADADCGAKSLNATCTPNSVKADIPIPMEAKVGFRFHMVRPGAEMKHLRDPMAQDIFDIEADLTWAHDSQFHDIGITVPANIPVHGTPSVIPPDASVPHNFKDVGGARFGGDYNVLPDQLAVRAGVSFETAASRPEYQNIDFAGESRFGIAGGATYRIHLGHTTEATNALELSVGLGHTFIATSRYTSSNTDGGVKALAGVACSTEGQAPNAKGICPNGNGAYRSDYSVNLGTITNAFTQINLGASYRF